MVDCTLYNAPHIRLETYPLEKQNNVVPYEEGLFEEGMRLGVSEVFTYQAMGKRLAEDITAPEDIPNKTEATMDGYAVRMSDLTDTHGRLKICSESYCSDDSPRLPARAAVYVRNGGMVPRGADTIVRVEEAALKEQEIVIERTASIGNYIRKKGSEARASQIILRCGTRIDFSVIGILGILGRNRVLVYGDASKKRFAEKPSRVLPLRPDKTAIPMGTSKGPRVTIFSTGSEIVPLGKEKKGTEVYEKNSYVLGAMLEDRNLIPVYGGILTDDTKTISSRILEALSDTDYVLITGGTSVARSDKINSVFSYLWKEFGFTIKNSLTIPQRKQHAYLGRKGVWALPGRTVRAIQILIMEVLPMLNSLSCGIQPHFDPSRLLKAKLIENELWKGQCPSPFVRIIKRPFEKNNAIPLPFYRELTCLANMNALVLYPKNGKGLVPGQEILVYKLS